MSYKSIAFLYYLTKVLQCRPCSIGPFFLDCAYVQSRKNGPMDFPLTIAKKQRSYNADSHLFIYDSSNVIQINHQLHQH